jgi:transcriptional regulator with XRE-family HTH domain
MLNLANKPSLGIIFRQKREEKGLLIRQVAAVTEMDQALVSRIENGDRLPTKEQLNKLVGLYDLDLKATYSFWLAERMIRDYGDEPYAPEAFREAYDQVLIQINKAAEPQVLYSISSGKPSANHTPNKNAPAKRGRKPHKAGDNNSGI